MKIRKTTIYGDGAQQRVYIYENKKEEYVVLSIPDLHWSLRLHYDDFPQADAHVARSLARVLEEPYVAPLVAKLMQWIREM